MMLGNGSTRKYAYDSRSQLTTQVELNASNVPIVTLIDSYDSVGNRMTRSVNGTVASWTYDDLYRLTGQQKSGQVCTYTLDGVGNLLTMWEGGSFPKTFTHNAADRLVTMVEGTDLTSYAYTGYGALESEITGNSTTAYAYSGQDQLILVTPPSGFKSTYTFDGDGLRRTAQEGNVQPTTMVWDGSDYLLLNEPGANRVVLTLESEIVACGNKDLLTDPLGSLVKEVSSGATLGSLVEMYPYGQLVSGTGSPTTPYVYVAAYGYYNDSLERDYVRARELYKKLGRWMQADPLWPREQAQVYARGRPVAFMDPSGRNVVVLAVVVVIGVVILGVLIESSCDTHASPSLPRNCVSDSCVNMCSKYKPGKRSTSDPDFVIWVSNCVECCNDIWGSLPIPGPPDALKQCVLQCYMNIPTPPCVCRSEFSGSPVRADLGHLA